MGKAEFEASRATGVHAALAKMAGTWEGSFKLWFAPGDPHCSARQRGTLRLVCGGRHLLHEYETEIDGDAVQGVALYGYHLDEKTYESAWVESFATGTNIMVSTQHAGDGSFNVLGSYGDGQGGPRWGWRTELEQPDDDTLVITMTNIKPDGEALKAVETVYRRTGAAPG